MVLPEPPDLSADGVDLVVDTNIWLDVMSVHDLIESYDKYLGDDIFDINEPHLVSRRARARESLLFARLCHAKRLKTFSLHREVQEITTQRVPPNERKFAARYMSVFANFVLPELLNGWRECTQIECDASIKGDDCDTFLVETCRKNGLSLVTHEGYGPNGIDYDKKIRTKAANAGVTVFTAREFWTGKQNPIRVTRLFFEEFDRLAPEFIRRAYPQDKHGLAADTMDWVRASLDHVLQGVTANTDQVVRVELPGPNEAITPLLVPRLRRA